MSGRKIDDLRAKISEIGRTQMRYYEFFPKFADRLAEELGEYLGDSTAVALTAAWGNFDFQTQYRHEGLRFEDGRYLIPIMVRLDNLQDDGATLYRFRLLCSLDANTVVAEFESGRRVALPDEGCNLQPLLKAAYEDMLQQLSLESFFSGNSLYEDTKIGFQVDPKSQRLVRNV
jgi:hypothetical protein